MAGSVKPANVSEYTKVTSLVVTSAVQFGFGHSKVAKKSASLGAVALCAGMISLPFFVEVTTVEVVLVADSVNGSTRFPPRFVHVPVNVEVTAKVTVAFVLPTPAISVPVQLTVESVRVQVGSPNPVAKCAPCGALLKSVTASAGTAARAVTSSESTAMMPNFLIKVFLLYLVGLYYLSLSTYKDVFTLSS